MRLHHALILACAALCGCRSNVDQAQEVALWRELLEQQAPAPLAAGETLTLGRALALANHVDERLATTGEGYLQALIDRSRQAALLYPEIGLGVTAFVRESTSGAAIPGSQDHRVDVPVQAVTTNLEPWSQVASLDRAVSTIDARRAVLLDAQAALLLQVSQAFYLVLRAERSAEVLDDSLALQEERVRDVEAQAQAGLARTLDVALARAQAANTRVGLVDARSVVVDARAALALLIGVPSLDAPLADKLELPTEEPDPAALAQRALELRHDLAAAHAECEAALHGVDVAVGQYYPSVSLNLSYFLYRETVPDSSLWAALVSANLPIFSFGRIHADVRAAWSVFRQAKLLESQVTRRIANDVAVGVADLHASQEHFEALAPALAAAQEAFDQSLDLVRAGKATNLERLVAQNQLLSAQLSIADAGYARKLAWLALRRASGTLDLNFE